MRIDHRAALMLEDVFLGRRGKGAEVDWEGHDIISGFMILSTMYFIVCFILHTCVETIVVDSFVFKNLC